MWRNRSPRPEDRAAGSQPRLRSALLAALTLALATTSCSLVVQEADQPLVVLLVRHAEKLDAGDDPALSPAGVERARDLAALLADAGLEHVHASDYARTRDTAAPVADDLGLPVELYDPRDLPALVARLRASGGRHLVVGHSNTTPRAVELLGGEPGGEIDEASEYDRLYVVTVGADRWASTVLLRYGDGGG